MNRDTRCPHCHHPERWHLVLPGPFELWVPAADTEDTDDDRRRMCHEGSCRCEVAGTKRLRLPSGQPV